MLSLVNVQISTTAKCIARRDLNDTSVSPKAEGDSQQTHENGEENTELPTCTGCVTDIKGVLRKDELRNGSEETIIGRDHLAKLDVDLLFSRIKMLLANLTELLIGMLPVKPMPSTNVGESVALPCPGQYCGNCEPQCLIRLA
jgi:hypothetical protein